jgi:hypothetical protein
MSAFLDNVTVVAGKLRAFLGNVTVVMMILYFNTYGLSQCFSRGRT